VVLITEGTTTQGSFKVMPKYVETVAYVVRVRVSVWFNVPPHKLST